MKYLPVFVVLFFFLETIFGSETSVSGVVLDAETRKPLPFTNIAIAGQYRGTVSNIEGHFILDLQEIGPGDTILFSYVGYETLRMKPEELKKRSKILMKPISINLEEVQVLSRTLSIDEILELVRQRYPENYPASSLMQHIFFHRYEKVPFPEDQFILKRSDFPGLDPKTFGELMQMVPSEFIEYRDAVVDIYSHDGNHKLVPVQGISLEESSQKDLAKKLEKTLGVFIDDVEKSSADSNIYYKFRSGIFSDKTDDIELSDSSFKEDNDTLNYHMGSDDVKNDMLSLVKDYATLESKNWEFLNKDGRYKYSKGPITLFNDELVYPISFKPRGRGLFEGVMYISTSTYAILQLDFAYAEGKDSETFRILGFGHAVKYKRGRVIFERGKDGYYVKYIYAQEEEWAMINRDLSIMKKQKKPLFDKELNEMKIEVQLELDINSYREILVLGRSGIDREKFESVSQPESMLFRKEYAYTPEMWNNRTVIAPTAELQKYKRKESRNN